MRGDQNKLSKPIDILSDLSYGSLMSTTHGSPRPGEISSHQEHLGKRDAFHCPGIAVKCSHDITPGAKIVFMDKDLTRVSYAATNKYHAIADPFLTESYVAAGTLFLAFPMPGATVGLRHVYDVTLPFEVDDYLAQDWNPAVETDDPDYDSECAGCY